MIIFSFLVLFTSASQTTPIHVPMTCLCLHSVRGRTYLRGKKNLNYLQVSFHLWLTSHYDKRSFKEGQIEKTVQQPLRTAPNLHKEERRGRGKVDLYLISQCHKLEGSKLSEEKEVDCRTYTDQWVQRCLTPSWGSDRESPFLKGQNDGKIGLSRCVGTDRTVPLGLNIAQDPEV